MHKKSDYGQRWGIAAALTDGPKTLDGITEHFKILMRRFGFFFSPFTSGNGRAEEFLGQNLEAMEEEGWVNYNDQDSTYDLTETGRREANKMLGELNKTGEKVKSLLQPKVVSKITFFVHLILGVIKFPAAILSGSVALLNDALDTLMDAFSSIIVFLGIRSGRERLSGYILLGFMIATGGYALWESISRFMTGSTVVPDLIAFIAIIISAVLSALLWLYQKYAGVAAGSLPIIAQSVDSRNHLLVAGGVGAGLIASSLGMPVIDLLVGVIIAFMILKGALDLLLDMIKQQKEGELDLSAYGFHFIEKHRKRQMMRWLLSEIDKGKIQNRNQLYQEALLSVDFEQISQLRAIGLAGNSGAKKAASDAISQLFDADYVTERPENGKSVQLTEKGSAELKRAEQMLNRWHGSKGSSYTPVHLILKIMGTILVFGLIWIVVRHIPFIAETTVWQGQSSLVNIFGIPVSLVEVPFIMAGLLIYIKGSMRYSKATRFIHFARRTRSRHKLVTNGPYQKMRHPMYGGWVLKWTGLGIVLGSPFTVALALLLAVGQIIAACFEEKNLQRAFGEAWDAYRLSVKRRFMFSWDWAMLAVLLGAWSWQAFL